MRFVKGRSEVGTSSVIKGTPLIRLVHPRAFADFLDQVGTPTSRLLQQQSLPTYCSDPQALVPLRQAWSLFDAAARLEDPMLGWHVGRSYGGSNMASGFRKSVEHAPTLYRALQECVRLISLDATHLQIGILERREDIILYTHYPTIKDWPGYTSSQAYQFGVYVDLIRNYLGESWEPPEIGIEYPSVPLVAKEQYPRSRILPGQRFGYLTVPRACLHRTVLQSAVATEVDPTPQPRDFDFLETVRVVARAYFSEGYPSAGKIARLLDISERTLHRRLSKDGLRFQQLIDEVRFSAAKKLLDESDVRVVDIAHEVGFADSAHFSRMFSRVGGLSPKQYRQQSGA